MKTVFIEVKVEDELPEKDGHYIAWMDDESLEFEPFKLAVGWWTETVGPQHLKVKTWFKEVPITDLLPNEGDIRKLLDEWNVQPPETQIAVIAPESFTELQKSPHLFRAYLTSAIYNWLQQMITKEQ